MANLEKRVQVLFSAAQHARVEAAAAGAGLSVGAYVRSAVEHEMQRADQSRADAWDRIFQRADALPKAGAIDWDDEKAAFERDILRDADASMRRAS